MSNQGASITRENDEPATLKIKPTTIGAESKLETVLVKHPDIIQAGLRVITHQQQTDTGPLDILAVDDAAVDGSEKEKGNALVVIELKIQAAEGQLDQGLRYYDWCRQNIAWIAEAFKDFNISTKVPPRLILVAPSFTETVRQIAKYVAIDLNMFEYQAVENEKGEKGLICREVDFGEALVPPTIIPVGEKGKRIKDPKVKSLWNRIIATLPKHQIEVRSVSGYGVTIWYKGRRFMWMCPRETGLPPTSLPLQVGGAS